MKSAKNLNATPDCAFCRSIPSLYWGSHAYQYRIDPPNAPMVAWHLLLMLRISLMIRICGIASHSSRRIRRRSCRLDVGVKRVGEKELLAVAYACEHLDDYIYGRHELVGIMLIC